MDKGIVRPMKMDDLQAILKIEQASFSTPWSLQAFMAELKDNEYARYLCLELDGQVIGYMGLWFILDEGHITNVAIAPDYRGKHWGEYLMRSMMDRMAEQGMERMTLEVRTSNVSAQSLYKKLGFTTAGVRKGYYADTQEDALIMWMELGMEVNAGDRQSD